MHLNSKLLFEKYARSFVGSNIKALEIGPSGFPSEYMKLINDESVAWDTLDIGDTHIGNAGENKNHIVSKELYNYPIDSNTYEIVIAAQVIEHVANIWKWLEELKRIVKPNGFIIIICPVSWPYHKAPIDCWRIFTDGMGALAEVINLDLKLAVSESLEKNLLPVGSSTYPNVSIFDLDGKLSTRHLTKIRVNNILKYIPFLNKINIPISVAYDTIGIFQKCHSS